MPAAHGPLSRAPPAGNAGLILRSLQGVDDKHCITGCNLLTALNMSDDSWCNFLTGTRERTSIITQLVFCVSKESEAVTVAALRACEAIIAGPKTSRLLINHRLLNVLLQVMQRCIRTDDFATGCGTISIIFSLCDKLFAQDPKRPSSPSTFADAFNLIKEAINAILMPIPKEKEEMQLLPIISELWANAVRFVFTFVGCAEWNSQADPNNIKYVFNEEILTALRKTTEVGNESLLNLLRKTAAICLLICVKGADFIPMMLDSFSFILNNFREIATLHSEQKPVASIYPLLELMLEQVEVLVEPDKLDTGLISLIMNFILNIECPIPVQQSTAPLTNKIEDATATHSMKGSMANFVMSYMFKGSYSFTLEQLLGMVKTASAYAAESVALCIKNSAAVESMLAAVASIMSAEEGDVRDRSKLEPTGLKGTKDSIAFFGPEYNTFLQSLLSSSIDSSKLARLPLDSVNELASVFTLSTGATTETKHVFSASTVTSGLEVMRQVLLPLKDIEQLTSIIYPIMKQLGQLLNNCTYIKDSVAELVIEATDVTLDLFNNDKYMPAIATSSCLQNLKGVLNNLTSLLSQLCKAQGNGGDFKEMRRSIEGPLKQFIQKLGMTIPDDKGEEDMDGKKTDSELTDNGSQEDL